MLDDSLPLTVTEWEEWGDPRVSVHEPAKWVARIRADEESRPAERGVPLLLRTALGGGAHTGPSGRYDAWAHEAFLHAVTLDRIARADQPPETDSSASASATPP